MNIVVLNVIVSITIAFVINAIITIIIIYRKKRVRLLIRTRFLGLLEEPKNLLAAPVHWVYEQ